MLRRNSLAICLTFLLVLILAVSSACAPQQRPDNIQQPNNQVPPPRMDTDNRMTDRTMADMLADEITNLDGVKSSYVLIVGRTAMIGINLNKEMDDKNVENLKDKVTNLAEKKNYINEALVSADPEVVEQIRDVFEGRSTPDSIGDIYTRLKPQS